MEFIALAVAALAFLVVQHVYHVRAGHVWDVGRFWRAGSVVLVAVVAGMTLVFGVGFLAAAWPFFAAVLALFVVVGVAAPRLMSRDRVAAPRQTLTERRAELVQQGKPTGWIDRILG